MSHSDVCVELSSDRFLYSMISEQVTLLSSCLPLHCLAARWQSLVSLIQRIMNEIWLAIPIPLNYNAINLSHFLHRFC